MNTQASKKFSKNVNGRWTRAEHQRFLKGLQRYGKDWELIQKVVKTRTKMQVRSHAQKVFLKFSKEDIDGLIGFEESQDDFNEISESQYYCKCFKKRDNQTEMSKRIDQPEEETKQSYEIFENKPKNVSLFDERMIQNFQNFRFGANFLNFVKYQEKKVNEPQNSNKI